MEIIRSESGDAYFLVPGSWMSRFLQSVIEVENVHLRDKLILEITAELSG